MTKSIKELLPLNNVKKRNIQARVDTDLVDDVQRIMKKHKLKWTQVITASLTKFKEDMTK